MLAAMGWLIHSMASNAPSKVTIHIHSQRLGADSAKTNNTPPSYQAKRAALTFSKQQRRVVDAIAHPRLQRMLARHRSRGAVLWAIAMRVAAALIISAAWCVNVYLLNVQ